MLSEEEKKAIEYYSNKEVSFSVDFDTEKLLKALGITEEDSFENHQIRFKTLLNLIAKLQKENEEKNKDIKKKDKIIYEMIGSFIDLGFGFEYCNNDNRCINDCDKCIKQYFERKVETFKLVNNKKQNT